MKNRKLSWEEKQARFDNAIIAIFTVSIFTLTIILNH